MEEELALDYDAMKTEFPLKATWDWTRHQYTRAEYTIARHESRGRKVRRIGLVVLAFMGLGYGYLLFGAFLAAAAAAGTIMVLAGIGGVMGRGLQIAHRARRFEKNCLPKHSSVSVVVDPSGVEMRSGDTQVRQAWTEFERWVETAEFHLLMWPAGGACYVPKSAIPAGDHEGWRTLLSGALPG